MIGPRRRVWTTGAAVAAVSVALAQNAPPCFFSEPFDGSAVPAGWDIGPQVEQFDDAGNGLGTFVDAWGITDADAANAEGHFPVPFREGHGAFIAANDDAAVCDCDLHAIALTSPAIDLTGRSNCAFEGSVFLDQSFGGGPAHVEASTNGVDWTSLLTVTAVPHTWQPLWLDLSAFDGAATLQVRFTWSDNGQYAAGLAIDDVCIYERSTHDLALIDASPADITADLFFSDTRGVVYRMLPLEQAGTSTVRPSAVVLNRGTAPLTDVSFTVEAVVGGTQVAINTSTTAPVLAPGERDTLVLDLGWMPVAAGRVRFNWNAQHDGADDLPDNQAWADSIRVTGAGFDGAYSTMAADRDSPDGSLGATGNKFSAGTRFELEGDGSVVYGLRVRYAFGTEEGAQVRARLMDGLLNELATSVVGEVSSDDLYTSFYGDPVYLPFTEPYGPVSGDVFALIESIPDSGAVRVATSGASPFGGAVLLTGPTEVVHWSSRTPWVRLALAEPMVGIASAQETASAPIQVFPCPASQQALVVLASAAPRGSTIAVFDALGRTIQAQAIPAGSIRVPIDVSGLENGTYVVHAAAGGSAFATRLVVQH